MMRTVSIRERWPIAALAITIGLMTAKMTGFSWAEPASRSLSAASVSSTKADKSASSREKSPVADGIVARYLMDPRGDVEGVLLRDGTQLHVTSRIAGELIKAIKPGDHVRAHGSRKQKDILIQPEVIVNLTTNISFSIPLRLDLPLPPKEDRVSMTPMKARGSVEVLLYGNEGEVQGMVLSDGTQIRLPPDVNEEFRRSLHVGENVNVEGYGAENEFGRAIEAIAMSTASKALTPLDPTIRQLP
jgi:hypothetical protein